MTATTELVESVRAGAILFGRYAFPPNRLGYCGPDEWPTIFEYIARQQTDQGLIELERRFDGAYPYLRLIALANQIADPFDRRVVEAYWIGNACLERVSASPFYDSLRERFAARMTPRTFEHLASTLTVGARPHHNFHVFDVYLKAGLVRDRTAPIGLDRIDHCRISWGLVTAIDGPELVVERAPIVLVDGKMRLGAPAPMRVTRQIDGRGFADDAHVGDWVSIHWNWACETLTPHALRRLQYETQRSLVNANRTV